MPFRAPLRPSGRLAADREAVIDRAVRPYRDALREIRGLAARGTLPGADLDRLLSEIDAAASRALGAPGSCPLRFARRRERRLWEGK